MFDIISMSITGLDCQVKKIMKMSWVHSAQTTISLSFNSTQSIPPTNNMCIYYFDLHPVTLKLDLDLHILKIE